MNKKLEECVKKLRNLVSDVQGAPYPGNVNEELYYIWYEHAQKNAMDCFEFLDEHFPKEKEEIEKNLSKIM